MAAIEYSGAARRTGGDAGLFGGITFWLARQVPSRGRFRDEIVANGGVVTQDESSADMKIHDHARKTTPAGTYSYTWIEQCIRTGILVDKAEHQAGVPEGVQRQPGDITQPTKSSRTPFTKEEDCILWDYVTDQVSKGGKEFGNAIYQQFAQSYPRHPFQSWRDRWKKNLHGRPRPLPLVGSDHITPFDDQTQALPSTSRRTDDVGPSRRPDDVRPSRLPVQDRIGTTPRAASGQAASGEAGRSQDSPSPPASQSTAQSTEIEWIEPTARDEAALMKFGIDIATLDAETLPAAFKAWAQLPPNSHLTAQQWQEFWEQIVRPKWELATGRRPQSPSQRTKANSSKRVTASRSQTSNSQSTESQQTSQESEPKTGKKRGRVEELSEQANVESASKRRSVSKQPSQSGNGQHLREDSEEANEESRSVETQSQNDPQTQISLSLTEPTPERSPTRQQEFEDSHHNDPGDDDEESQDKHQAMSKNKRAANISDESQGSEDPSQPLPTTILELTPTPETQEEHTSSSYSFTTTPPGNTQRERHQTPTPKRRNQASSPSSQFTTTPPGNTAPVPLTSSVSIVQDSQEERTDRLLRVTNDVRSSETAAPEARNYETGTSQDSLESLTQPAAAGDSYDFQPDPEFNDAEIEPEAVEPEAEGGANNNEAEEAINLDDSQKRAYEEIEMQMEEFMRKHTAWGYSQDHIVQAMLATSYDMTLAERAVRFLKNHGKLPDDIPGIWTDRDDRHLQDPKRRARVVKLHGEEICQRRQDHLANMADEQEEDGDDEL